MKKYLIGAVIPVAVYGLILGARNFGVYGKRAKTAEVKIIARELSESFAKKGTFEGETGKHYYRWSAGDDIRSFCPDCRVDKLSFKILIYGNIDSDPALDIWSYRYPGDFFEHLSNDVTN